MGENRNKCIMRYDIINYRINIVNICDNKLNVRENKLLDGKIQNKGVV